MVDKDIRYQRRYRPSVSVIDSTKSRVRSRSGSLSPMRKSLAYMRDLGFHVEIVEHYVYHAKVKRDLWGLFDLLAVGAGKTIAVQTTSRGNMYQRKSKILGNPIHLVLKEAGWILEIHGWDRGELHKITI